MQGTPLLIAVGPDAKSFRAFVSRFDGKDAEFFLQSGTTMLLVSHDLEEAVYLADEVLLLTKRPTRIAEILHYGDARPRTVATLSEPSFIATKKRSLEIFQREVRR